MTLLPADLTALALFPGPGMKLCLTVAMVLVRSIATTRVPPAVYQPGIKYLPHARGIHYQNPMRNFRTALCQPIFRILKAA